ncbi:nuclear basket protein megator [Musca autumnalis]|uniref:nuclear basket protein megator n=1 Tax=Musca autumnalis TaxID=221902 RepID=UPI003CECDF67
MTTAMDLGGPQEVLTNILTQEELEQTPKNVQDKLKKYLDEFFDEYYKDKAAANRLHDYELKADELQAQIQDYEVKLENFNQNVTELRSQLDTVSAERKQLLETTSSYERELASLRNDKKAACDERDHLLKVIERHNSEIERLQQDLKAYQQQLKAAIAAKCEALARVDEIESKEVTLDFKERRMEQERDMLHKQIQNLTQDLNRNISELQNIRRENTMNSMQLEARLSEKTEELKIVQIQCTQYKETIERLTQNVQELSQKILSQSEEAQKMMDYYKKELDAKAKLADLYKSNCEDTEMERTELTTAISDLKRMLAEASDQYGELETNFKATQLRHEQELDEKQKNIDELKEEIKHANELLKELKNESVENAISKLAPTAAVASRLIRADMSLTELYSLYVKTSEECEMQKRELARLNLQLKTILSELNENAPMVKKQELEYEKLLETNNILAQQRDEMLSKKTDLEELLVEATAKISHMDRENRKLKHSQTDLSRQVCYLLKEVEQLRIGLTSEGANMSGSCGNLSTTDEVISKKLVTFNNITELQENNQKLLLLVRDLSSKLEEAENLKQEIDEAAYQEKLENYAVKFQSMQDTLNQQNNTVATLVSKCERYKKLYFELQRKLNKQSTSIADDMSDNDDEQMQDDDANETLNATGQSTMNKSSRAGSKEQEKRIKDLEQQLHEVKEQYKTLKEQYEYYSKEKKNNEKLLNEQFDSMRSEVRELTSTNCKLMSSLEYTKEQIKLQQKNIATYKQQITALEDRNKNYENSIVKHEQTVLYLKDEVMKCQRQQSAAESEASRVRHENRILKDSVGRLQAEKEAYHREQQSQTLLLNNLELIKANLERSETEGKARLEQRLDETVRELSAQRRRFQEEEDRFRETTNDLKRQTESAKKLMQEEKEQADKLRMELINVREELTMKTQQIDELSKKLQESLTPSKNDNPIALANKKAREFEVKYEEAKIEIESLQTSLKKAKEHADQYYKMSQNAESEIKNLHELHTSYVEKAEAEIKDLCANEQNLKSRITELEADLQLSAMSEAQVNQNQPAEQVKRLQDELKDTLQKLSECNRNLRSLRSENITLSENLNSVESKYANEMILHSADIQELGKVKQELVKVQSQISELTMERDSAKLALENHKKDQEESLVLLRKEKEELEKRLEDLNSLNANLHDQIEALSNKLATLSQAASTAGNNDSVLMDTSISGGDANRSMAEAEAENKSNEQLLQIIKFLRKEKDLTLAKLDILKAENTRLQSEFTILQKKNDELQDFLNRERSKTDTNLVSASKHEEILRKIETLNAVTDSNRVLREERNALTQRVKELNDRISALEDELFPLQNQNRDLNSKIEEIQSENNSLRTEALKWRQRANVLVEKSNKNPEEFKRLQSERENLAKMLTAEKEQIKSLTEELQALKGDKTKFDGELASLERQVHMLTEEKKSLTADITTMKVTNSRLMQEVMEMKNKLLSKEEAVQKITEDLEAKEHQLQDSKNKEVQIRKIAKRYKDSYLELLSKAPATGAAGEGANANAAGGQENIDAAAAGNAGAESASASNAELEQQRSTIENLNGVIRTMQEENEKIRKDYEDLKASVELDERTKTLLREAKSHIVSLTESRNVVSTELAATKTKLLQSNEAHEAKINELQSQFDTTLQRLERELLEQNNRNKEDVQRLTRENESLIIRINQLNRQLGLQQSAKPSTSSVAISDKGTISDSSPRTANVKPMSGTATVQQSATVTPWRGGETPLASIRPISVQNTRTAAILPTSQQSSAGSTAVVAGTSTSTSSTSSTSTPSSTPSSATASSNTALVPPQQQVHTTGSASLETMSSSPTSSHTDYMPSTSSSASVAVAAIPPMGSAASAAESSQEAESIQQPQQNEPQPHVSGGNINQTQVVALVSPRVEGSSSATSAPSVTVQLIQDPNNPQPSTSQSSSAMCSSHIAVSSHNRHTPSSSNVTTTQAGTSAGHKRPRELEGDSSTTGDDTDKGTSSKHPKRMRAPMHSGEAAVMTVAGVSDSGIDVDQVPTSSQRDQEDDVVVLDSEEDDGMAEAEADEGGPADADGEHEVYEDYDQDQDMDENECPEANEGNADVGEADNNEVDVDEDMENNDGQCSSAGAAGGQADADPYATGASTSAAAAAALAKAHSQDNNQQSQAISSGSGETPVRKQTNTLSRQQKATLVKLQQGAQGEGSNETSDTSAAARRSESSEIVSSPQDSKFGYGSTDTTTSNNAQQSDDISADVGQENADAAGDDSEAGPGGEFLGEEYDDEEKKSGDVTSEEAQKGEEGVEGEEDDFNEEGGESVEASENIDSESHLSSGATQSEDVQQNQIEATSEENEGADGVSSEGEKQAVEEVEEEGREAEASTSPSINTRSKATKGVSANRRPQRGFHRGGAANRPTPIVWQESPGNSQRNTSPSQRAQQDQQQGGSPGRGGFGNQRGQRARRMRRPAGNFSNRF